VCGLHRRELGEVAALCAAAMFIWSRTMGLGRQVRDSAFKNLLLQESFFDNGIMPLKIILLQAI
jgi:hypothetical protein